jgi:hypothetical protein
MVSDIKFTPVNSGGLDMDKQFDEDLRSCQKCNSILGDWIDVI